MFGLYTPLRNSVFNKKVSSGAWQNAVQEANQVSNATHAVKVGLFFYCYLMRPLYSIMLGKSTVCVS